MSIVKHKLPCCALCQITASDTDTIEELSAVIEKAKEDALLEWNPKDRTSGERACFIITTPQEQELQKNLRILGFNNVSNFNRRNGYPQTGKLRMWFKSW